MESLRLEGPTIRGVVQGRPVNCIVRSVPDGLALPSGQYLLRVGENNPIYGVFLAVEAAGTPERPASYHWKLPPSALKDSPAAAVLAMVPCAPRSKPLLLPSNRALGSPGSSRGGTPSPSLPMPTSSCT